MSCAFPNILATGAAGGIGNRHAVDCGKIAREPGRTPATACDAGFAAAGGCPTNRNPTGDGTSGDCRNCRFLQSGGH